MTLFEICSDENAPPRPGNSDCNIDPSPKNLAALESKPFVPRFEFNNGTLRGRMGRPGGPRTDMDVRTVHFQNYSLYTDSEAKVGASLNSS